MLAGTAVAEEAEAGGAGENLVWTLDTTGQPPDASDVYTFRLDFRLLRKLPLRPSLTLACSLRMRFKNGLLTVDTKNHRDEKSYEPIDTAALLEWMQASLAARGHLQEQWNT